MVSQAAKDDEDVGIGCGTECSHISSSNSERSRRSRSWIGSTAFNYFSADSSDSLTGRAEALVVVSLSVPLYLLHPKLWRVSYLCKNTEQLVCVLELEFFLCWRFLEVDHDAALQLLVNPAMWIQSSRGVASLKDRERSDKETQLGNCWSDRVSEWMEGKLKRQRGLSVIIVAGIQTDR